MFCGSPSPMFHFDWRYVPGLVSGLRALREAGEKNSDASSKQQTIIQWGGFVAESMSTRYASLVSSVKRPRAQATGFSATLPPAEDACADRTCAGWLDGYTQALCCNKRFDAISVFCEKRLCLLADVLELSIGSVGIMMEKRQRFHARIKRQLSRLRHK